MPISHRDHEQQAANEVLKVRLISSINLSMLRTRIGTGIRPPHWTAERLFGKLGQVNKPDRVELEALQLFAEGMHVLGLVEHGEGHFFHQDFLDLHHCSLAAGRVGGGADFLASLPGILRS